MNTQDPKQQIQKSSERAMEFVPFGAADKIKMTVEITKNIIAVPTRSGKTCTDRDALKFMMLCQAQRLNPFAGDAFLVGYDTQNGPSFSLITAHQAFLKRAETCADYEGMDSGVIIQNGDDSLTEREGDFHLPEENVVGGWAKVYRKGRRPTYRRIRMARFNNGFAQWKQDPAGMIVKCSEADALRSTFPTLLGGLYMEAEIIDIGQARDGKQPKQIFEAPKLVDVIPAESEAAEHKDAPPEGDNKKNLTPEQSPQGDLADFVVRECGSDFTKFQTWAMESGTYPQAETLASFDDLPAKEAKRLLNAKTGLKRALQANP